MRALLLFDASGNNIDAINTVHLPPGLSMLYLRDNPCTAAPDYR